MDRLWESYCQRGGTNDGHSSHADCDYVGTALPHRTGGGGFRRVPQRDGLGRHDGDFHRPNPAKYAARASSANLSAESRRQLPIHILDSLACSIAALGAGPVDACRAQVTEVGGTGPSTLIGGGQANPIYAAFWHTALVRYVDFMDNFLAPTETCHTADNFGVALTITEYTGA